MTERARTPKELTPLEPVQVPVFGSDGKDQGSVTFEPGPIHNFPNIALLKEAVRRQQGLLRRGTASTKNRSKVNGAQRKPWRQKGTGRARAGTRKSPIWRGGGVAFGPKPRKFDYGLPRKQQRLARRHAVLSKLLDGETRVIEGFPADKTSTGTLRKLFGTLGIKGACLIGLGADMTKEQARMITLSCRNLPRVKVVPIAEADTLSLLKHGELLLTRTAFEELQQKEREQS